MRSFVIALTIVALGLTGCKSKQALELNNTISGYTLDLEKSGKKLNTALIDARTSKDFSEVDKVYKQCMKQLNEYIGKLDETENVGNSEKLIKATKDLFTYDKNFFKETVQPLTKMDENTSDEDIQAAYQKMADAAAGESKYTIKLQKEQQAYAKENGFKIKENPVTVDKE